MKVLSIGRDNACDIILNDEKDLISRRHAILYITFWGKMTLVSQGQNGTYVNGIRINPNVLYPVTRKDIISFAHVKQLDWKLVPNPFVLIRTFILVVIIALIAIGGILFLNRDSQSAVDESPDNFVPVEAPNDTIPEQKSDTTSEKKVVPQKLPSKEALKKKKEEEKRKAAEAAKKKEAEKKDSVKPEKVTPPII